MSVAGFGFRAAATPDSLRSALMRAGGAAGVTGLAAPADKCASAAFRSFADALGLPVIGIGPGDMSGVETATDSARVRTIRGTGSVAEAAALAAAGPGARLVAARAVSDDRMATCAIAQRGTT